MRSKFTFAFGVLIVFSTSARAGEYDPDQNECAQSLGEPKRGSSATTMLLPPAADVDALIDRVVHQGAEAYGEDPGQIKAALMKDFEEAKVEGREIHNIEYQGALETVPPQHQFKVTTRKGLVIEVAAIASPEHSLPISAPVPPAVTPPLPPMAPPPVTTLPLPRLSDLEAALDQVVDQAASQYGEGRGEILTALRAGLAEIQADHIHSVRYEGALESLPPQHEFTIIYVNGRHETIWATVSSVRP